MKRSIFIFCCILAACGSENNVELAKPLTFVRYYNGGYDDEAKLIKETKDGGFIILSNGARNELGLITNPFGCKVTKIDVYGNQLWQKTFFKTDNLATTDTGKDLLILEKGYLLLGGKNIIQLDEAGNEVASNKAGTGIYPNIGGVGGFLIDKDNNITGAGVTLAKNNNYLVTGLKATGKVGESTVFLGELDATSFKWNWLNANFGTTTNMVNRLFKDGDEKVYWACQKNDQIALIKTAQKASPDAAPTIGTSGFSQSPFDLTAYGNGFAILGVTNEKGVDDICLYKVSQNAALLFPKAKTINLEDGSTKDPADEGSQVVFTLADKQFANSVTPTQDGGLIILGTTKISDRDFEYLLIKVDGLGNLVTGWPKYYGSKTEDIGACVIQASDGSIMLLGTTKFGGTKTIFLMKADKDGGYL